MEFAMHTLLIHTAIAGLLLWLSIVHASF